MKQWSTFCPHSVAWVSCLHHVVMEVGCEAVVHILSTFCGLGVLLARVVMEVGSEAVVNILSTFCGLGVLLAPCGNGGRV